MRPQKAVQAHAYPELDALRGVAAIAVMLYHYALTIYGKMAWLPNSFLAVDFFFLLSGFVIAHTYERRLLTGESTLSFMRRRFVRLFPLHALVVTVALLYLLLRAMAEGHFSVLVPASFSYALNLMFLPSPVDLPDESWTLFPLNTITYTLSLEMGVNLVYALLCRYLTTAKLCLLVVWSAVAFVIAVYHFGDSNFGWNSEDYWTGWIRVFYGFFGGALLYRFYSTHRSRTFPLWSGLALLLVMLAIVAFTHIGRLYSLANCLLIFPLMIWVGAKTQPYVKLQQFYTWLGLISYGLYLIHLTLLNILMYLANSLFKINPAPSPALIGVYAVIVIVAASALDRWYDRSARNRLEKITVGIVRK